MSKLVDFENRLIEKLKNLKDDQGIFDCGQFDLDVDVSTWNSFVLYCDESEGIKIDLLLNKNNALEIQRIVEKHGHRLIHTWGMQYTENLK